MQFGERLAHRDSLGWIAHKQAVFRQKHRTRAVVMRAAREARNGTEILVDIILAIELNDRNSHFAIVRLCVRKSRRMSARGARIARKCAQRRCKRTIRLPRTTK